jgi:hypothetical protein
MLNWDERATWLNIHVFIPWSIIDGRYRLFAPRRVYYHSATFILIVNLMGGVRYAVSIVLQPLCSHVWAPVIFPFRLA